MKKIKFIFSTWKYQKMQLSKGSLNFFKIHIFITFRVHKSIPSQQISWYTPSDLKTPQELCAYLGASQIACKELPAAKCWRGGSSVPLTMLMMLRRNRTMLEAWPPLLTIVFRVLSAFLYPRILINPFAHKSRLLVLASGVKQKGHEQVESASWNSLNS